MNTSIKTILVAIDFSTGSRAALEQADRLARNHGAKLHVMHVIDSDVLTTLADRQKETFESAAKSAVENGCKTLETWLAPSHLADGYEITLAIGAPLHEILEHVKSLKADLLVAGVVGTGENPTGAGTIAGKLARKSTTNVLLVRSNRPQPFQRMVACIDFSDNAQRVLSLAHEMALKDKASIDFLHVWADPGSILPIMGPFGESGLSMTNASLPPLDELVSELQTHLHEFVQKAAHGIAHREILLKDHNTGHGIANHARQSKADLIIIGALGRTNLRYLLLGSTAERVLRVSACSVLVVKPAEA